MSTHSKHIDEAAARRVLMVQAHETGPAGAAAWTAEDRATATRLARETTPADAPPARYIDERARHALHLLAPRDKAVARALDRRHWRRAWVWLALLLGFAVGVAMDTIGSGRQHVDLLAPPVWAIVAWNLVVYLTLPLPLPRRLRASLANRWNRPPRGGAPLQSFGQTWQRLATPLSMSRAALLLHAAAAAVAAGVVAGLYLRGLVLDYRAGWQSTFLDAATVREWLAMLLWPASQVTGIGVPDAATIATMRVGPGEPATATAAPWIHLHATTLALFVVVPRLLLAAFAATRARWLSARFPLPLNEPYFQRLLREHRGGKPRVQLLPHGAAPSAQAALGLRAVLAQVLGPAVEVTIAPTTVYGDEESAGRVAADGETTLRLALVDLGATPEDDTHGRFVDALRTGAPGLPLLLLADRTAFVRRFGAIADRVAERRAAWQRLADAHGVALVVVDLDAPDVAAADADFDAALAAGHAVPASR